MMEKTGLSTDELIVLTCVKERLQMTPYEKGIASQLEQRGLIHSNGALAGTLTTQGEAWIKGDA